jgi:hypothetical protein
MLDRKSPLPHPGQQPGGRQARAGSRVPEAVRRASTPPAGAAWLRFRARTACRSRGRAMRASISRQAAGAAWCCRRTSACPYAALMRAACFRMEALGGSGRTPWPSVRPVTGATSQRFTTMSSHPSGRQAARFLLGVPTDGIHHTLRRMLALAQATPLCFVAVTGPDAGEAMSVLWRKGYDRVEAARRATCRAADEQSDVLLIVGCSDGVRRPRRRGLDPDHAPPGRDAGHRRRRVPGPGTAPRAVRGSAGAGPGGRTPGLPVGGAVWRRGRSRSAKRPSG